MARTTAAATTDHAPTVAGPLTPEEAGRWLSDLFEEHGRMVYGVCRILLRDPQDAEDASQQTFLSAHRSLLAGTRPRDPAAWLGTIARNECRERMRARARVPLALVSDPAAPVRLEDVAGGREEVEALCAALAELPHQQREAIVLREFYGLSYDEVRAALGVSGSAVESLIFRARKRLQKELRPARAASGAIALPIALHASLAHAIPGFAGAHRAGILAKLAGAPLVAKLAAATLTVTVAGVVGTTAVERHHGAPARPPVVAAKTTPAPAPSLVTLDLGATSGSQASAPGGEGDGDAKHDTHGSQHDAVSADDENEPSQDEQTSLQSADSDQTSGADDTDDTASADGQDGGTTSTDDTDSGGPSSGDNDPNVAPQDGEG
jgi:RNA polymerase sigma factor (sigma-70 family)